MANVRFFLSVRFLLTCFVLLSAAIQYMQKTDLGMAIVCMVNNTALELDNKNDDSSLTYFHTSPMENKTCLFQPPGSTKQNDGPFEWNKKDQGLVLSSYFYGYLITQIPSGWFAYKFGSKRVIGYGMLFGSLLTLLVPLNAYLGFYYMVLCVFLIGFIHGFIKPATSLLFLNWAPMLEKSRLIGFADSGNALGSVFALMTSGYLCQIGEWALSFYIFGIIGIVWVIFFMIFFSETPNDNKYISKSECEYINETTTRRLSQTKKFPWLLIFKSKPCIAIFISHTCANWANYLFLTQLPSFMNDILRFDSKSNGLFSTLPHIVLFFITILSSIFSDFLIAKEKFSRKVVRKIFNGSGFLTSTIMTIGLCFVTCESPYIAVGLLTIGYGAIGMCIGGGYHVNVNEVGGEFCSILYGISNTIATIPGIIAPSIVGLITKNKKQGEWQEVFIISSCIYLFGFIFYTIFADCESINCQNMNNKEIIDIKNENDFEDDNRKW